MRELFSSAIGRTKISGEGREHTGYRMDSGKRERDSKRREQSKYPMRYIVRVGMGLSMEEGGRGRNDEGIRQARQHILNITGKSPRERSAGSYI